MKIKPKDENKLEWEMTLSLTELLALETALNYLNTNTSRWYQNPVIPPMCKKITAILTDLMKDRPQ